MEPERRFVLLRSHIERMPPLSPTVSKILSLCNSQDVSPIELNKVISLDPVLTGNVLRMINSAYYGLAVKINSVVRAITMLGINTVRNLLLSMAVLSTVGKKNNVGSLDSTKFWEHSLATGVTAKLIASKHNIPIDQMESFFIAGLLHDIGKIPLNNRFPDEYSFVIANAADKKCTLFDSEQQALGINHSHIGKLIADKWNLSTDISDTIEYHHSTADYEGENKQVVYIVAMADYFINSLRIGNSGNTQRNEIPIEVLNYLKDHLGVTLNSLSAIIKTISNEVEKSRVFLTLTNV
jgi:putative nucleotidyltransferase with HDIG domain